MKRPDSLPVRNYYWSSSAQKQLAARCGRETRFSFTPHRAIFHVPCATHHRVAFHYSVDRDSRPSNSTPRSPTPPLTTTSTLLTSPHIIQTSVQADAMQRCCSSILPRLGAVAPAPFKAPMVRRSIHDIAITRTGKPIIRTPGGGRSACRTRLFPCPQIQMN